MLELTHNWDTDHYEIGTGYGHIALGVDDIRAVCEEIRAKGGAGFVVDSFLRAVGRTG